MSQADRADVFRGMAHPLRRRVLSRLREADATVGELRATLGVTGPTLSQHLAILREAGLVESHPHGQQRIYRLCRKPVERARNWIAQVS